MHRAGAATVAYRLARADRGQCVRPALGVALPVADSEPLDCGAARPGSDARARGVDVLVDDAGTTGRRAADRGRLAATFQVSHLAGPAHRGAEAAVEARPRGSCSPPRRHYRDLDVDDLGRAAPDGAAYVVRGQALHARAWPEPGRHGQRAASRAACVWSGHLARPTGRRCRAGSRCRRHRALHAARPGSRRTGGTRRHGGRHPDAATTHPERLLRSAPM